MSSRLLLGHCECSHDGSTHSNERTRHCLCFDRLARLGRIPSWKLTRCHVSPVVLVHVGRKGEPSCSYEYPTGILHLRSNIVGVVVVVVVVWAQSRSPAARDCGLPGLTLPQAPFIGEGVWVAVLAAIHGPRLGGPAGLAGAAEVSKGSRRPRILGVSEYMYLSVRSR